MVAAAALLAAALWQFVAFSSTRAVAQASKRFNAAAREVNSDEMVSAARGLWKVTKEYPKVMLAAADAAFSAGRPSEALQFYESILDSKAPAEAKLQAKLGLVALKWAAKSPGERDASVAEAKLGLDEAAAYAADSPDVEFGRAILDAHAGERAGALEKIKAALGGLKRDRAAFLSTLWSAYVTAAACEVDAGGMEEALEWLRRARGLKPSSADELAPLQLKLRLALAARMGANKEVTRVVLAELDKVKTAELTPVEKYYFAVAQAIAYLNIGDTEKAIGCLEEATKIDPDRVDAHIGLAFVKYTRNSRKRQTVVKKAEAHQRTITAVSKPKKWGRLIHVRRPVRRLIPAAVQAAVELHAAEEEFIGHLRRAYESGQLSPERVTAIKWFLALVYLRQARSFCNEPEAEERLRLAEEMLRAVVQGDPKNAAAARARGILVAMKGDAKTALDAFKRSLAADAEQEDLAKIVEMLSANPEAAFHFPDRTARCAVPLIGAAVKVKSWKGLAPELSKAFLDGREVSTTVLRTAVCHLPSRPLSDGDHSVKVVAVDVLGNSTEVSFSFAVDGTPPRVESFSPRRGEAVSGPRVPFKISLADAQAGVSVDSIRVVLSSPGGTMRFVDVIVDRGRYVRGNSSFGVTYRAGEKVDPSGFTVVNWRHLTRGEFQIAVHATDLRGNEMPVFKTTFVVGGGR